MFANEKRVFSKRLLCCKKHVKPFIKRMELERTETHGFVYNVIVMKTFLCDIIKTYDRVKTREVNISLIFVFTTTLCFLTVVNFVKNTAST